MTDRKETALQIARAGDMITAIIDKYETSQPRPDCATRDRAFIAWYRGMLLEIGSQVKKLSVMDPLALDSLFKNVYIPLSIRNGITPKINDFCLMIGTDYSVIDRLFNNSNNPVNNPIYNSWLVICRESLLSDMLDSNNSNINHIFISKAVYGLSDQPKQAAPGLQARIEKSRAEIIAEISGDKQDIAYNDSE